jgi:hypothetical protein
VIITEEEIKRFSDISNDRSFDLVKYYYYHGRNEEGQRFVQFLVPVDVLPPEKINKKAFQKYRGIIMPEQVRVVKDSTGLFDKQEITRFYFLTLHKDF